MPRYGNIVGTGTYLPEIEVSNDDLRTRFAGREGLEDVVDRFEASTGIRTRWYAPASWAASDLAVRAARQALERAGRRPADVDLLIVGTDSPDYLTPATSVVVQNKLGASNAGTFDIGCACASFATGLASASGWLAVNPALQTVLVIGVYMMHKLADPDDPMIFFYGDGAGAAVIEADAEPGFVAAVTQADGSYAGNWGIFAGATAEPASVEAIEAGRTRVRMIEKFPPEINHEGWPRLARRLAREGGFGLDEVDLWILTQVRKPSIPLVLTELGVPPERGHTIMEEQGYTGSACLGMAFHDAIETGRVKPGNLVVFIGSGVGYNQAATAFRMRSVPGQGS